MHFLKDHEGKVVRFLLADAFVKGTLDRAPKNPEESFTLIHATRYPINSQGEEHDYLVLDVSQIMGWGGKSMGFLDAEE